MNLQLFGFTELESTFHLIVHLSFYTTFPSGVNEISQSESKYCCFHQVDTNTTQMNTYVD